MSGGGLLPGPSSTLGAGSGLGVGNVGGLTGPIDLSSMFTNGFDLSTLFGGNNLAAGGLGGGGLDFSSLLSGFGGRKRK